jgi:pilus assembly protein Flp/PilA
MHEVLAKIPHRERGATAVEYGIMVALIAAVIVALVATLGTEIQDAFQTVVNQLQGTPADS